MLSSRNKIWKIESFRSINHWRHLQNEEALNKPQKKLVRGAFGNQSKFNKNKKSNRINSTKN